MSDDEETRLRAMVRELARRGSYLAASVLLRQADRLAKRDHVGSPIWITHPSHVRRVERDGEVETIARRAPGQPGAVGALDALLKLDGEHVPSCDVVQHGFGEADRGAVGILDPEGCPHARDLSGAHLTSDLNALPGHPASNAGGSHTRTPGATAGIGAHVSTLPVRHDDDGRRILVGVLVVLCALTLQAFAHAWMH